MTNTDTIEILNALGRLPPEKADELRDFALFLRDKYGQADTIEYSDEWTDEDMQDIMNSGFEYAYGSKASEVAE